MQELSSSTCSTVPNHTSLSLHVFLATTPPGLTVLLLVTM